MVDLLLINSGNKAPTLCGYCRPKWPVRKLNVPLNHIHTWRLWFAPHYIHHSQTETNLKVKTKHDIK